jgi:hypothetical protein
VVASVGSLSGQSLDNIAVEYLSASSVLHLASHRIEIFCCCALASIIASRSFAVRSHLETRLNVLDPFLQCPRADRPYHPPSFLLNTI